MSLIISESYPTLLSSVIPVNPFASLLPLCFGFGLTKFDQGHLWIHGFEMNHCRLVGLSVDMKQKRMRSTYPNPSVANCSARSSRSLWDPPKFWSTIHMRSLVHAHRKQLQLRQNPVCVGSIMPRRQHYATPLPVFWLLYSSWNLLDDEAQVWKGRKTVLFRVVHMYSQHLEQPWISLFTVIYSKRSIPDEYWE